MNHLRENPFGVDKKIDIIQKSLYKTLSKKGSINGFSRVYLNPHKDEGMVLQSYVGSNNYEDVLRDNDSRFFFYLKPTMDASDQISATLGIVFMIDLDSFYNESATRRDEEFRGLAFNVVERSGLKPKTIYLGLDYLKSVMGNVFTTSSRARDTFISTNFKFEDMQPLHTFVIETEVNYSINICN